MASSTTVDLSRLPAPQLVDTPSHEAIVAAMVADLRADWPNFDALTPSDPAYRLLHLAAHREELIRATFNDRARQLLVAFATGASLDHLGALLGVVRLVLTPATLTAPALLEADDAFRQRIVLGPEGYSVAGPELAYVALARAADSRVLDASATSPAPGEVVVTVLARAGDGAAPADLVAAVAARVTDPAVRPLGDAVTVASAEIRDFAVEATLRTFAGPDTSVIVAAAQVAVEAYLAANRLVGRDITRAGLTAALFVPGVQNVSLLSPAADIVCSATQAAHCSDTTIVQLGYAD